MTQSESHVNLSSCIFLLTLAFKYKSIYKNASVMRIDPIYLGWWTADWSIGLKLIGDNFLFCLFPITN